MAAYVIASIEVTNPELYEEYRRQVLATVEKHGGKFIVRGGAFEKLEGNTWNPKRVVILEFQTMEQAKTWYDSPEYSRVAAIRQQASIGDLILVQGV